MAKLPYEIMYNDAYSNRVKLTSSWERCVAYYKRGPRSEIFALWTLGAIIETDKTYYGRFTYTGVVDRYFAQLRQQARKDKVGKV